MKDLYVEGIGEIPHKGSIPLPISLYRALFEFLGPQSQFEGQFGNAILFRVDVFGNESLPVLPEENIGAAGRHARFDTPEDAARQAQRGNTQQERLKSLLRRVTMAAARPAGYDAKRLSDND